MDTISFMELCKTGTLVDIQNAIQSGADVNALDNHLRTPLMFCRSFNPHPKLFLSLFSLERMSTLKIGQGGRLLCLLLVLALLPK